MRVMAISRFGAPEVLTALERPVPSPGPGEVAIDVAYAGVNFAEILFRRGAVDVPLPYVPGIQVAGHVRALGAGVTTLRVGEPVAALTIMDGGGYAEVALAPATLTFSLEDLGGDVDLATAAAATVNVTTAYAVLTEVARLRPGERVLVHAAAGGVGGALGQVARILGAGMVLGTVGSVGKADAAEKLGYDRVCPREGFVEAALVATGGARLDVVVDPIGGPARAVSLLALGPLGRLVVMGNASGAPDVAFKANDLWFSGKGVLGFNLRDLAENAPERVAPLARKALAAVARGAVRVPLAATLPLADAVEAHRRLEGGATTGTLVLQIAG